MPSKPNQNQNKPNYKKKTKKTKIPPNTGVKEKVYLNIAVLLTSTSGLLILKRKRRNAR